jgi:hypothetical protein
MPGRSVFSGFGTMKRARSVRVRSLSVGYRKSTFASKGARPEPPKSSTPGIPRSIEPLSDSGSSAMTQITERSAIGKSCVDGHINIDIDRVSGNYRLVRTSSPRVIRAAPVALREGESAIVAGSRQRRLHRSE